MAVAVTEQTTSASSYYTWEVTDKKITILVDFGVVDRLSQEVMRGFGAVPRRGAEVGGLLLGSVETGERTVVRIEDFEPVACEHRRGPSYLLSENDLAHYEEALDRHRFTPEKQIYVVGCYRSHTREGLSLTAEDVEHFQSCFPAPSSVFLLVKPFATRVSTAGFFFREEDGSMAAETHLEFPFRRRDLGGGTAPSVRLREGSSAPPAVTNPYPRRAPEETPPSKSADSVAEASAAAESDFAAQAEPSGSDISLDLGGYGGDDGGARKFRRTNVWIPLSFIFLLLGVLIGFQVAFTYRPARAAGVLNDPFALTLSVARSGDNLHVRWDRTSTAVRNAQRGVLFITDGTYNTAVDLDVAQLNNPSVFYRHMTGVVQFRLEVFTKERISVSETLEWRK
ncbi:MAG: hypothetical protein HY235_16415 [Acidobacteria bacterium]|nr:hypothetical protein [Acidobacteriota bacterium]